jgi:hypothetical protein
MEDMSKVSDGCHTFEELYDHRMALTVQLTKHVPAYRAYKHNDGTMYKNYFVVMFYIDNKQCSYHYHMDNWGYFDHLETLLKAEVWDGHTAEDVLNICKGKK